MAKNKKKPKNTRQPKKARLKKKVQTRAAAQVYREAGLTEKQIKTLPASARATPEVAKKAIRAEQQRTRRNTNRQKLIDYGIPLSIIKKERLDSKGFDKLDKALWKRRGQKLDELTRNGIKDFNKSDLDLGWQKLIEKYGEGITPPEGYKPRKPPFNPNIRFIGEHWLYIGAAEVQGGFGIEDLSDVSDARLRELIVEHVRGAAKDIDGSESLYAVFQVRIGTRSQCTTAADEYHKRGYNLSSEHLKLVSHRYGKVTVSNTFSQREFHEMVYNCITQMKNDEVRDFYDEMCKYCNMNGWPFMDNLNMKQSWLPKKGAVATRKKRKKKKRK